MKTIWVTKVIFGRIFAEQATANSTGIYRDMYCARYPETAIR
jgi:hypothetical protein